MDDSRGYGSVQRDVMRDKTLPPQAKALYALLASYAGKKNYCFPTVTTLCEDLGLSKPMITKYLAMLQERGIIQKTMHSGGKSNNAHGYEILNTIKESKPVVTPPIEPEKPESESKVHLTLEAQKLSTVNLQKSLKLNGFNLQKLNTLNFSYNGRIITIEKEHVKKEVRDFFGVKEQVHFINFALIGNAIDYFFENDLIESFYTQFLDYKQYKSQTSGIVHSVENFLGNFEGNFNGKWSAENWAHKLKITQNKGKPAATHTGTVAQLLRPKDVD